MSYILDTSFSVHLPTSAENPVISELLSNYTYGRKYDVRFDSEDNCITIGNYTKEDVGISDFVINITDNGVYIEGQDFPCTMRGFVTFLEQIKYSDCNEFFYIETGCIRKSPLLNLRCVHLCVFPETDLDFLKKCVRSCAIAKYSHIIFEFWGMLKFDCLKELSWPFAYSKEEIKKILREANALGVEIIPMFNHLGHASACREINGKHVVLDQNPCYEYMFNSHGWIWNFKRTDVYELLSKVRNELIELCGPGSYFHIGCDEAYGLGHDKNSASDAIEYINKLSRDLNENGRRCIMWHDMILDKERFKEYYAHSNKEVSELFIKGLDKNILIADWQYSVHGSNWLTSEKLKAEGFDVVCCPWDNRQNIHEAVNTATDNGLSGIIHTTWHTLFSGFRSMIYAGVISYGINEEPLDDMFRFYCSSVARKALPSHGDYERSGWSDKMTGPGLL